jgi:hypothetical protein
MTNTK